MSRREFLTWFEFHRRNPIDPVGKYQRPAAFLAFTVAAENPNRKQPPQYERFLEALVPVPDEDEQQNWFDSL